MNLEELRRIREQERATDSVQNLRADFYADVADYLSNLRAERDARASEADDPFTDTDVKRLSDELQAAERTVEALYERRVGKIVKLASFAAANMSVEVEGLTREETELFETIVETIQEFTDEINNTLDSAHESDGVGPYRSKPAAEDSDPHELSPSESLETTENEPSSTDTPSDNDSEEIDRTTVRITEEVGPIVGIDERDYDLGRDDIVTLPVENARPLIEGDVAEPIDRADQ